MTSEQPLYEKTLQRDIDLIRDKVTEMYKLDHRALTEAIGSLKTFNRQQAYSIILRDERIDELEKEIDRLCLEFLVRQQPVALHLRFAYVTIKINQELERIGDYAESIARQVLKISKTSKLPPLDLFEAIANISISMLESAVKSFLEGDAGLARQTMEIEEETDNLRDQINNEMYELQKEGKIPFKSLAPLLTIGRRFERVADQAKNLCEEVIYMCTGEYAKHKGKEVWRILFVDDHNSYRSQMAEGIGNSFGLPKLLFRSAGLEPKEVEEPTIRFMGSKNIDISRQASLSIEHVPNLDHYHIIIALSKRARKLFPKLPGKMICLDWHIEAPPDQSEDAHEEIYQFFQTNIQDLGDAILGHQID